MKNTNAAVAASFMAMTLLSSASFAQGRVDYGQKAYESSCASCHGVTGKGDGTMRPYLVKAPTDLTTLAKRNGGVFPVQRIWETIDGRSSTEIGPHGAREMPVWGDVFRGEDTQPRDLHARNRIASLVDYLARMQAK